MTDEWMSTAAVARLLGVKPQTVYAYVSRGLLTPTRRSGSRASWFPVAEVERLRGGERPRSRGTGMAESIQTSITLIDRDRLWFKGIDATSLANRSSQEDVARLLWDADPDLDFTPSAPLVAAMRTALQGWPVGSARQLDRLRVAVLAAGLADPWRADLAPQAVRRRAATLLASLPIALASLDATAASPGGAGGLTEAWSVVVGLADDATGRDLVRRALVLLADHDIAISTTVARATASVRADPYSVIEAALAAMNSPLHGAAGVGARRVLDDFIADPATTLGRLLDAERPPVGFGHRIYRELDPRAEHLREHLPPLPEVDRLESLVLDRHGWFPNTDWMLARLSHSYGLPAHTAETLFAAARLTGWVAHALEEYAEPSLRFRFEGIYRGPRPSDSGHPATGRPPH